jgi:tetratricopeptide (TPR) repeat protein
MTPGRNDPCPCGSGRRYKHCCGAPSVAKSEPPQPGPLEVGALVALVNEGRPGDAERQTRLLLNSYPDAGILWKILGVVLVRQGKEALQALRRAAELLPLDAEAHANLGAALHDRRDWQAALVSLSRALELEPRAVQTLIDTANTLCALGRAPESLALYQRALALDPRSRQAHNNLGNAYLQLAAAASAVDCYREALRIKPDDAEVLCNLGNALRQTGELQEALNCSQRALALEPGLAMAHNNLGLVLAGLGRQREAVASYRQAVKLNPHYVEALDNLGNALRAVGERREALALRRKAVELNPHRADGHGNLGQALFELRRLEQAESSFRRALSLQVGHPEALLGLAQTLRMLGRGSEAEACCRAVLDREPSRAEALTLLGELRADRGQFSQAQELFQQVLAARPDFVAAFCSIAAYRRMSGEDSAWLTGVQALLAKPLALAEEIGLNYALGKYYDDIGHYEQAFGHYREANELSKRYGAGYDRNKLTQRVSQIIGSLDGDFMRRCHAHASDSGAPVFIIGMPRSGTSLTEQILASHPAVFGAGEVRFWDKPFGELETAGLGSEAAARLVPGMARDYLERVTALAGGAARVTDKMPANFLYAGLIHAVFPRARIIHMQRHPLDTCLSIYFQNFFTMGAYAKNDLEDLAHYYGEYLRITAHWRAVLPAATLLEVPYEGLIADQEGWTRRMLEFIGLPWDARCLDFHQTERAVITPSRWQVRQKIHNASVGRWRNYTSHIGPLEHLVALAGAPGAAPTPAPTAAAAPAATAATVARSAR